MRKFPTFLDQIVARIGYYTDPDKYFFTDRLNQIPFFQALQPMDKNALTFHMELKTYISGAVLQSPGDLPGHMMIIVKGVAVLYTMVGDEEFKIEYFKRGDIINHTLFLYQKPAVLNMKCVTDCDILLLAY